MRIGIVNDLRLAVETLRRAVATIPGASVAWVAEDGAQAVAKCAADTPDIVLMDMVMPVMDGVEATRRIMRTHPCPILVVTATVEGNADKVFESLGAGAIDAVATPTLGADGRVQNDEPLVRKIHAIDLISGRRSTNIQRNASSAADHWDASAARLAPIVAIGASTGGPDALAAVLKSLPRPIPWPVVIIQHVDPAFAPGLADWLGRETGHRIETARAADSPAAGMVTIAATGDHLIVDRSGRFRYTADPRDHVYRPSVDVFFDSLEDINAMPGVAVVLTGMGRDGAAGLMRLRSARWHTIAQNKSTSVVWGMPGAAVEIGAAIQTLSIGDVAHAITKHMAVQMAALRRTA